MASCVGNDVSLSNNKSFALIITVLTFQRVTTGVLVISEIIFCLGLPKDDIKHHFRSCFPSAAFDLLSSRLGRFGRRIWSVISWPIAKLIPLGKFTLAYLRKQKQRRSNAMELRKRGQSRSSTAISLQDQSKSAKHACLKVNENANLFQAFSTSECWGCTNTICNVSRTIGNTVDTISNVN